MSISPGYTAEQIRGIVEGYYRQPYGARRSWLEGQGISYHRFLRWRYSVYAGDLERGLIARTGGGLSMNHERQKRLARDRDAVLAARDAEIARLTARLVAAERTNDVLGKAIGLLHTRNEQESDETPTTTGLTSS